MAKKPSNLIYDVTDKPPIGTGVLLGLQHVFVISVGWIFVVVIVTAFGGTREQARQVIQISMIASGVATILQARPKGPVGSGYLCPLSVGPAYISASILAGKLGGLPLLFGLTAISGLFEALLSRLVQRLRVLFPPEVTGLVVAMVGIELIALAAPRFLGFQSFEARIDPRAVFVAVLSLAAMIGPSIWSTGKLKLYPVLLGLMCGYGSAYALGLLSTSEFFRSFAGSLLSLPQRAETGWSFDISLLPPFFIACLASTLKSVGDLTLCQKANDLEWKRTDLKSASGGILAESVGTTLAGLFGGVGQSTFSSNVGLSIATGATSRHIALPCGVILILLAFIPGLAAVFTIMPPPVMGAILVYVACFMILGGIQVITSRMLDARRTFVVGIPFIFGLSVAMVPGLYAKVPEALAPMFGSSLSLATILVIVLHLLFRIGVKTRAKLLLSGDDNAGDKIFAFMENQGALWGARKEVIVRATAAMNEFFEAARALELANDGIRIVASFDEFNLDVDFRYRGALMEFPTKRPSEAEILEDEMAVARLAGFLIKNYADKIRAECHDRNCRIQFHFDH
jgi:NCS2 family nucleobase:cation symporter-2